MDTQLWDPGTGLRVTDGPETIKLGNPTALSVSSVTGLRSVGIPQCFSQTVYAKTVYVSVGV